MKPQTRETARPLTLADLCEAIETGQVTAEIEDGYYTISRRALRQLRPAPELRLIRTRPARPARIAS